MECNENPECKTCKYYRPNKFLCTNEGNICTYEPSNKLQHIKNIASVGLTDKHYCDLTAIRMVITREKQLYIENKGKILEDKEYQYCCTLKGGTPRPFEKYEGKLYPYNCHVAHIIDTELDLEVLNDEIEYIIEKMYSRRNKLEYEKRVGYQRLLITFYNKNRIHMDEVQLWW